MTISMKRRIASSLQSTKYDNKINNNKIKPEI
jgi:hypothetical protein